MADKNTGEKTDLAILSDVKSGEKVDLNREKITIGRSKDCDIVFDFASVDEKAASIERKNGLYVLKTLSGKDISVSGEKIKEKILAPGDLIKIGQNELRFNSSIAEIGGIPLGPQKKQLKGFHGAGNIIKGVKLSGRNTRNILAVVLLIAGIFLVSNFFKPAAPEKTAGKDLKAAEAGKEHKEIKEDKLVYTLAASRQRFKSAEMLYDEANIDDRNMAGALVELYSIVDDLDGITPLPDVYIRAKKRIKNVSSELDKQIKYFRNNAFAAFKTGNKSTLRGLLIKIINMSIDPKDENYIWAKKKLLKLK